MREAAQPLLSVPWLWNGPWAAPPTPPAAQSTATADLLRNGPLEISGKSMDIWLLGCYTKFLYTLMKWCSPLAKIGYKYAPLYPHTHPINYESNWWIFCRLYWTPFFSLEIVMDRATEPLCLPPPSLLRKKPLLFMVSEPAVLQILGTIISFENSWRKGTLEIF